MAVIKCPECDGSVSEKAVACPHCGFPMSEIKKEPRVRNDVFKIDGTTLTAVKGEHSRLAIPEGIKTITHSFFASIVSPKCEIEIPVSVTNIFFPEEEKKNRFILYYTGDLAQWGKVYKDTPLSVLIRDNKGEVTYNGRRYREYEEAKTPSSSLSPSPSYLVLPVKGDLPSSFRKGIEYLKKIASDIQTLSRSYILFGVHLEPQEFRESVERINKEIQTLEAEYRRITSRPSTPYDHEHLLHLLNVRIRDFFMAYEPLKKFKPDVPREFMDIWYGK